MSNSLLTATSVSREALRVLHQKLNFIGSIERQYDDSFAKDGAKTGDTLKIRLPNQWSLRPVGRHLALGDFPVNLALHPSGKYLAVLHAGYGTMVNDKQLLETIADMWTQVGVKAKVDMMEMARRQKMNNDRATPPNGMLLGNPQSTLLDVDGCLWRLFHPNGFNGKYWAESQPGHRFHDIMEQARYSLDQKKRKDLYREATRIVHEEKPWIELFQEVVIYGVSKKVTFKPRADFRVVGAYPAGQEDYDLLRGDDAAEVEAARARIAGLGAPPDDPVGGDGVTRAWT